VNEVGIALRDLGVRFQLDRSRRVVTPGLARLLPRGEESWGIRGVNLAIGAGESVGLVGATGSGKTTLLRVLAGVLPADEGEVAVAGRIGSLLSIQAGVLARLTGAENAVLLGVLSGLSRRDARRAVPRIRERSGLGKAFDHPVITYSQGMRARLGFAAADCADPQILLLDEVHEALDHDFRAVVDQRAQEIRDAGGIVVAAGHDHMLLARMCGRVVVLRAGAVVADGPAAFDEREAELRAAPSARLVTPLERSAQGVG
jgi:ABC-type polysaccharide/polyol phosphate transport system ATPase subunit